MLGHNVQSFLVFVPIVSSLVKEAELDFLKNVWETL